METTENKPSGNFFSKLKQKWLALLHNEELKQRIYKILFESDTFGGKLFDLIMIIFILSSVTIVIVTSIRTFSPVLETVFKVLEWVFTIFFTIEYILRIYSSPKPRKYIGSSWGMIDLITTLPTYLDFLFPGFHQLLVIRMFRLLRLFQTFKMSSFVSEGNALLKSIRDSSKKIIVFFFFIVILVICVGTIMYMVEGNLPGTKFKNIPDSIYWAVVTLTTVGYGDITPITAFGRFLSAVVMLMGYTIIAIPTGIVINQYRKKSTTACPHCQKQGHDDNAEYCKHCGKELK